MSIHLSAADLNNIFFYNRITFAENMNTSLHLGKFQHNALAIIISMLMVK